MTKADKQQEALPTEEQVREFLRQRPDFLRHNDDLLVGLDVPHAASGGSSLLEHQIAVMKEQHQALKQKLRALIELARENQMLTENVHKLSLSLALASDPNDLFSRLTIGMCQLFQIEAVSLGFDRPVASDTATENFRLLTPEQVADPMFAELLAEKHAICGRLKRERMDMLFAANAKHIGSVALLPLLGKGRSGILAIGSEDEQKFYPGMGTEILSLVAETIIEMIGHWATQDSARRGQAHNVRLVQGDE